VILDPNHVPPPDVLIEEVLDWFDRLPEAGALTEQLSAVLSS
jgi:hypothetical protein